MTNFQKIDTIHSIHCLKHWLKLKYNNKVYRISTASIQSQTVLNLYSMFLYLFITLSFFIFIENSFPSYLPLSNSPVDHERFPIKKRSCVFFLIVKKPFSYFYPKSFAIGDSFSR